MHEFRTFAALPRLSQRPFQLALDIHSAEVDDLALLAANGWSPASDEFLAALDCCRLHLAVLWLGWSPEWSPPPEHAQNWLGEALRLAEQLGNMEILLCGRSARTGQGDQSIEQQ